MKRLVLLLLGFAFLSTGTAQAFDWFGGRLSIGGGYGLAKPKLPYSYQDTYEEGGMWTAHAKYFLTNDWSVVASYADLQPHARGDGQDTYRFRPMVASVRYNLFRNLPFSPYITGGAGYSLNKREAPGIVADKWDGFTWQGGLGLEFFITEGTSLGAEALYHHFNGNSADSFAPHRLVSGVGTVNFYFGAGPSKRRAEEALANEKERANKLAAEAEASKNQALTAQQGQLTAEQQAAASAAAAAAAQQGQMTAEQQAAAAAASAAAARQASQASDAQMRQAQAEVDEIKQMVAAKTVSPVTFATGSANLQPSSNGTLDKVAGIAKKYPNLKLRVEGHTDSTGNADSNQTLSQKRADSVRDYLSNAGVPASQISSVGFGQTRPVASNGTSDGRLQNRRVEFIFNLP